MDDQVREALAQFNGKVVPWQSWKYRTKHIPQVIVQHLSLREEDLVPLVTYYHDGVSWTRTLENFLERYEPLRYAGGTTQ